MSVQQQQAPNLSELVERLRVTGFRVDPRQYFAAHEVLWSYALRGKSLTNDIDVFISHLGPIFCTSSEEQVQFSKLVKTWLSSPLPVPPTTIKGEVGLRPGGKFRWLLPTLIVLLSIGVGLLAYRYYVENMTVDREVILNYEDSEPKPAPSSSSSSPTSNQRNDGSDGSIRAVPQIDWFLTLLIAGGVISAIFGGLTLYQWGRRRLIINRLATDRSTELVKLTGISQEPPRMGEPEFRRLVSLLRRPEQQLIAELDVVRTSEATARNMGLFCPIYKAREKMPEYLALISCHGEEDHQAKLYEDIVERLRAHGVPIDMYYFRDDPRYCFSEHDVNRYQRLRELTQRYHQATLFIFVETADCFNPLSGRLRSWSEDVSVWPRRVIFTPESPYCWNWQHWELASTGFIVLPAGDFGLQLFAALQDDWRIERLYPAPYARSFPQVIENDTQRWLDRNEPSNELIVKLLRQLRGYLGLSGFVWLCACAVYPEISWVITLYLMNCFPEKRQALQTATFRLARLPWFRQGFMPDWLRRALIAQLAGSEEAAVRKFLKTLLEGLIQKRSSASVAGRTVSRFNLAAWTSPMDVIETSPNDSPLRDTIFVSFIAGASINPLSFEPPAVLRKLFRKIGLLPNELVPSIPVSPRSLIQRVIGQVRRACLFAPSLTRFVGAMILGGMVALVPFGMGIFDLPYSFPAYEGSKQVAGPSRPPKGADPAVQEPVTPAGPPVDERNQPVRDPNGAQKMAKAKKRIPPQPVAQSEPPPAVPNPAVQEPVMPAGPSLDERNQPVAQSEPPPAVPNPAVQEPVTPAGPSLDERNQPVAQSEPPPAVPNPAVQEPVTPAGPSLDERNQPVAQSEPPPAVPNPAVQEPVMPAGPPVDERNQPVRDQMAKALSIPPASQRRLDELNKAIPPPTFEVGEKVVVEGDMSQGEDRLAWLASKPGQNDRHYLVQDPIPLTVFEREFTQGEWWYGIGGSNPDGWIRGKYLRRSSNSPTTNSPRARRPGDTVPKYGAYTAP